MTTNPETLFKQKVQRDLKALGKRVWAVKTQERARHGIPDFFACLKGRFVGIELKTDHAYLKNGGKAEPLQEIIMGRIREAGGTAFVATPAKWAAQLKVLKQMLED